MKKLIVTILLVSVLGCGCGLISNKEEALSQNEEIQQTNHEEVIENPTPQEPKVQDDNTENLHPIEIEEQECMKKANYTTAGMTNCAYEAMDSWFKEIDKYLGLLKTVTSEEDYANILKAQEDWKKYQESEFVAIGIFMKKQGTIFQNITAGERSGLVKQRALNLKSFYQMLTFNQ